MSHKRTFFVLILLILGGSFLFWAIRSATSPILISNAVAVIPVNDKTGFPIYLNLENAAGPDTLTDVSSQIDGQAELMGVADNTLLAIPAGSAPSLSADGAHIMFSKNAEEIKQGSFIPLTLNFKNAGKIAVKALVTRPAETIKMSMENDSNDKPVKMNHSMHDAKNSVEIDPDSPAPAISIQVEESGQNSQWRVVTRTSNFEFVQSSKMLKHKLGQGHAHLYLNGMKLQRLYGEDAVIGALPKGRHIIRVTLNTNDHRTYSAQGTPISATKTIVAR